MITVLEQLCEAVLNAAGEQRYQIRSTITSIRAPDPITGDSGDLPFPDIFVMKMLASNEPKSDVFQRIGTIVDLNTLTVGRDAALAKNQIYYLINYFFVEYPDVITAGTAKQLIQARVDRLIGDWIAYNTKFITPVDTDLPLVDPDILSQVTSAYKEAKADKTLKDIAVIKANADKVTADAEVASATSAVVVAQAASDECVSNLGILANIKAAETEFYGTAHASGAMGFKDAADAFEMLHPDVAFRNRINVMIADLNTVNAEGEAVLASFYSALGSQCSAKHTAVVNAQTAKGNADQTAAVAATTLAAAVVAAAAAQTALDAALAAALAACPTFDPTTV